jgi:hypothetical protein
MRVRSQRSCVRVSPSQRRTTSVSARSRAIVRGLADERPGRVAGHEVEVAEVAQQPEPPAAASGA